MKTLPQVAFGLGLFGLPAAALAQTVVGNLRAENALRELSSMGSQARGNIGAAGIVSPTFTGVSASSPVITMAPTASSLVPGLVSAFTVDGAPLSTDPAYPSFNANTIKITSDDAALSGVADSSALYILHDYGGSNMSGGRITMNVQSVFTATSNASNGSRQYVAGGFESVALANDGGTDTGAGAKGALFGFNPYGILRSGATNWLEVTGGEVNFAVNTGASVRYKAGLTIVELNTDAVAGTSIDADLDLSSESGAVGVDTGIQFSNMNGQFPLNAIGTAIKTTNGTFNNGIDFSSSTMTGNFILGPDSFVISSLGVVNGVNYKLGVDSANGSLLLGASASVGAPHLDFDGHSSAGAGGYGFRIINDAANSISFLSTDLTVGAFKETGLTTIGIIDTGTAVIGATNQLTISGGTNWPTLTSSNGSEALTGTVYVGNIANLGDSGITGSFANYVAVSGAATGNQPTFTFTGTDTNVNGQFAARGTGSMNFGDQANGNSFAIVDNGATVAGVWELKGATATTAGQLFISGTGNVDVGTGAALAASATSNFLGIPYMATAPTGTPVLPAGGAHCVFVTGSNNLNCYNPTTAAWVHFVGTTGAL